MRVFSIVILIFLGSMGYGQENIFASIGSADAEALGKALSNDVEVCIGTDQDFYSRAGAVKKLDAFFAKVKPTSSAFKHKGSNKDKTSEYSVGTMSAENGKWRIFIYYEGEKVTGLHFNQQ